MKARDEVNPKTGNASMDAVQMLPAKKNHAYLVGAVGHIYAYATYPRSRLWPVQAMLQISVQGTPITTLIDGLRYRTAAHFVRPTWIEIDSDDAPVVAFMLNAYGVTFRSIRAMPKPITALPREMFAKYDAELRAAIAGTLDIDRAKSLFAATLSDIASLLPQPQPADERVGRVLVLIRDDINLSVESLASAVSLSADRLSHLFTAEIGISLRRFRLSLKLERAVAMYRPGMSVNELALGSGFSDLAHLSRASREIYGAPPSYFLQNTDVHF